MRTPSSNGSCSHILVADDEPSIVGFLTSALIGAGFRVTAVMGLDCAVALLTERRHDFAAAVLGAGSKPCSQVIAAVRTQSQDLPLLVTSASTAACESSVTRAAFLRKPFRTEELLRDVRTLLECA